MQPRTQFLFASVGVWIAFVLVQIGGLALATPLVDAGVGVGGDPGDPRIGIVFVIGLLIATAIIYVGFQYGLGRVLRALIFLISVGMTWFVLDVFLPATVVGDGITLLGAIVIPVATFWFRTWWLINGQALILGIGIVGLFGSSFAILPILILLVILAAYDAISVYGTKHMLTLAEDAVTARLPVLFVIPLERGGANKAEDPGTKDGPWGQAMYIGLGDAVIPSMLIVSAVVHLPVDSLAIAGIAVTIPALTTMLGITVALASLLALTASGRPHAGLPLLNTGAIAGYLVGALIAGLPLMEAIGVA